MLEFKYKESWALKNWCFWTVALESPLDCKEIQPVHLEGDKAWVFIGRTDAEVETPIFWPPDAKIWLIWKDPDAGKDWRQEKKGTTEDEMVGWHHQLNRHGFGWTQGVGDGQGGLACCGSWGRKESDTTEWLNWTEQQFIDLSFANKTRKPPILTFSMDQHFFQNSLHWRLSVYLPQRLLSLQLAFFSGFPPLPPPWALFHFSPLFCPILSVFIHLSHGSLQTYLQNQA